MILRDYQQEAITKTGQALRVYKRVVLTAATGAGKSLIIAGIVQRFLVKNPTSRVLILCHQAEILLQNKEKLEALDIQCSVYCAGLGKKETFGKVVLASRDSCATKNSGLMKTRFALILVDECHLVSNEPRSHYQKIFAATQPTHIVGLTGSPYRMSGGVIFGKNKFWECESFRVTVADLQERGYLCPHVFPKLPTFINTEGVKSQRGDFVVSLLEQRSSTPDIVSRCISEWNRIAVNRKCSIFFCVSVAHAVLVRDEIAKYTPYVALITGETTPQARERLMTDARAGKVKAICNVGVMTTGIDIPVIDCVVFLRATESVSLMIQMSGRGLRVANGKENCLFLDFTGNWQRFGGLDDPLIPKVGTSKNNVTSQAYLELLSKLGIVEETTPFETPKKECPKCSERVPNGRRVCGCGHIFINHTAKYEDQVSKLRGTGWKVGYVNLHTLFLKEKINSTGKNVGHCLFSIGPSKFSVYLAFTTTPPHFGHYNQTMFRKLRASKENGKPLLIAARKKTNAFDEMRIINVRNDQSGDLVCE